MTSLALAMVHQQRGKTLQKTNSLSVFLLHCNFEVLGVGVDGYQTDQTK